VTVEISDTARGRSVRRARANLAIPFEVGVGIPSMQERINSIGGHLNIDSTGCGTTVSVSVPHLGEPS
jgi:signal transduction histidine kinase